MDFIKAAIFGIIQGLTEFLPVSSSGHLVVLHKALDLPFAQDLIFDVILHLATLLSVIWFFRKDLSMIIKSWLKSFIGHRDEMSRLSWQIVLATVPAALAGYFFGNYIESTLRSIGVVISMLFIVGLMLILIEKFSKKLNNMRELNWPKSIFIGLAQTLALIPGTSRSGITIIAGMAVNLKREAAIRFSFLLSIPIIAGANIKKIPEISLSHNPSLDFLILFIGFICAFFSGLITIKYFIKFSQKHSLAFFGYYRFALAAVLLALYLTKIL